MKHSEETKKKISLAKKGKPLSEDHKRKVSAALKGKTPKNLASIHAMKRSEVSKAKTSRALMGHPVSQEAREKMRLATNEQWKTNPPDFSRRDFNGENHPGWKGGRLHYLRKQALLRDNFTCQICGLHDEEIMEVDHAVPRFIAPHLTNTLSNLVSLCPNCHARKTCRERKEVIRLVRLTKQMRLV